MIELHRLTKRYGPTVAVDDLTVEVPPGRVTALVGPNGSGKSTVFRLVAGLDRPDAGHAWIHGVALRDLRWPLREVGIALEDRSFHPGRTAHDHLLALARTNRVATSRVTDLLDMTGLSGAARRRAGQLSTGMRRRLGIGAALLGDPQVLLLDEPTNGLDSQGVQWLETLLGSWSDEGRTVLLAGHGMDDLVGCVDQIILLDGGRLAADLPFATFVRPGPETTRSGTYRSIGRQLRREEIRVSGTEAALASVETRRGPGDVAGGGDGRQRLGEVLRSEWAKLWSVRSTVWCLVVTGVAVVAIGAVDTATVAVRWSHLGLLEQESFDPAGQSLVGILFGQLTMGVLGVLVLGSEYGTGAYRSTFVAVPDRVRVLVAKVVVLGTVALALGEAASFAAFFLGQWILRGPAPTATLGEPGVLGAIIGGGLYLAVLGLLGLGLAAVFRRSVTAICVYVTGLLVLPLLVATLPTFVYTRVDRYLPAQVGIAMTSVQSPGYSFAPWTGLLLLCGYVAVTLCVGGAMMAYRDA